MRSRCHSNAWASALRASASCGCGKSALHLIFRWDAIEARLANRSDCIERTHLPCQSLSATEPTAIHGVQSCMGCGCMLFAYLGLSLWDGSPRMVHYEIDDWRNTSWGFHAIDRRTIVCLAAIAGDGSRANQCSIDIYHHYLFPYEHLRARTLYLRPANSGYEIDDEHRTVRGGPCACSWQPDRQIPDDSSCSRTASALLPHSERIGSDAVAGQPVISIPEDRRGRIYLQHLPRAGPAVRTNGKCHPG